MLLTTAILCVLIGAAHSFLGERYLLSRLFRGGRFPHLFGSDYFARRTLRFAWHITTVAWWGFGYLLWVVSTGTVDLAVPLLRTVGVVFLVSGLFSFGFTGGRHVSWVVFWAIAALSFIAASG